MDRLERPREEPAQGDIRPEWDEPTVEAYDPLEGGREPESLRDKDGRPPSKRLNEEDCGRGRTGYSEYSAGSTSLSVAEPSRSIPVKGSVNPVGPSSTGCISALALPSLPIFSTTDRERVGIVATELDRPSGIGLMVLTGEVRPLEGLLRMPLVVAMIPLD